MEEKKSISSGANNKTFSLILTGLAGLILVVFLGLVIWQKNVNQSVLDIEDHSKPGPIINWNAPRATKEVSPEAAENKNTDTPFEGEPMSVSYSEKGNGDKAVGYLKSAYQQSGKNYITIDYAEYLTGKAALKAMIHDGVCMQSFKDKNALYQEIDQNGLDKLPDKFMECIPMAYYFRNNDKKLRTLEVAGRAHITKTGVFENLGDSDIEITFQELMAKLVDPDSPFIHLPYQIKIENGIVTEIIQWYIP